MNDRAKKGEEGIDNGEVRIIEEKIHPDVFTEFYRFLEESNENLKTVTGYAIKTEFAKLAKAGSIESFRHIERIIEDSDLGGIEKDFGIVALNYCRFRIENELLDIQVGMVSGGLGGTANKIRYYLVLTGKDGITSDQLIEVEAVFKLAADDRDSIIEEVKHHGFYVSLSILGSLDYAIGDLLTTAISECKFLEEDYFLTNVEIPTGELIQDWLDGKLDETS